MNSTKSMLTKLKSTARTGWVEHGVANPESVAEHSHGTALLCLCYGAAAGVDAQRAAAIAVVHDLAEAVTGDSAWRPDRDVEAKHDLEITALETIGSQLHAGGANGIYLKELAREYIQAQSAEARFVRDMNLIDMALQAEQYGLCGSGTDLSEFIQGSQQRLSTAFGRTLFRQFFDVPYQVDPSYTHT